MLANFLENNNVVAAGLAAIAAFFLLTGLRRRQRDRARRDESGEATSEAVARLSANLDTKQKLRRDLEELIVELQELSRQISAQIDTKFAKLEAAIRDADRRIAVLSRLSSQSAAGEPAPAPDGLDVRYTAVYELADAGNSPMDIARQLGKTPGEVELILNLRRVQKSEENR